MADIGGSIQTSWGSNAILSMFPNSAPTMQYSGLDAVPDVTLIDTQIYKVDIFNDYKVLDAKGAPMQTIWFTQGGGVIARPYDIWTDEYIGEGYITVPWEHLRLRDADGYNSQTRPYRVGESGELGGKLIWQKVAIQKNGSGDANVTDFDQVTDGSKIHIMVPKSTSDWGNDKAEIKEIGLVTSGDKKIVPLGFSRQGAASRFTNTIGQPYKVLEMLESTARARKYKGYNNIEVDWSRRTSAAGFAQDSILQPSAGDCKTISYLYDQDYGSKRFHVMLNNLSICKTTALDNTNVYQFHYAHKFVGLDQIIFTKDMTEFVMVLDFAHTNIDFLTSTTPTDGDFDPYDNFVQFTSVEIDSSLPTIDDGGGDGAIAMFPGDIKRFDTTTGTGVHNNSHYIAGTSVLLLEEVNTAAAVTAGSFLNTDRVFGVNVGVTDQTAGGATSIAPFVTINLHDDLPAARHETEGFPTTEKTGYKLGTLTHHNFTRIHHSDPWTISIDSQNTEYKLRSTIERNRRIYMSEFKKDWNNIFLYEKGQNLSDTYGFKGTTSGVMDRERFPIRHAFHPLPTELFQGDIYISDAAGGGVTGRIYQKWLEDLSEMVFGGRQRSDAKNVSMAIGKDMKRMIRNVNAAVASTATNVFGWNLVTQVPQNKLYLGIPTYEYDAGGESIMFFEDPSLNDQVDWKLPYYLYPNANGKASPRFLMIGFDKSNIGIMTRKGRQEQIYGNLQSRNNPFVYTESVSSSHMMKVRFCATNHNIINFSPNYLGA